MFSTFECPFEERDHHIYLKNVNSTFLRVSTDGLCIWLTSSGSFVGLGEELRDGVNGMDWVEGRISNAVVGEGLEGV